MRRGHLRVYLGYAAGTGKTFAMLEEGHRRVDRGTDVIIGLVETHGRVLTAQQQQGLEIVPRKKMVHRGSEFEEMDLDAILVRTPEVALVDELAHTNVPGSRNPKRWQDVEELLEAGITVITTVNIQHLESLNDVVETITGIAQRETIPDEIVRSADQIELVDMSPWALRRRMAHGNVYPPEKIDVALTNYFREGNLAALRELALLWLADRVEESLKDYIDDHGIEGPWETRERVLVGLSGRAEGTRLIRRAARIASRRGAELIAVHVVAEDDRGAPEVQEELESQRRLLVAVNGTLTEVMGDDVASTLLEVARAEGATQIVLGASSRSRWSELIRGSAVHRVIRESGPVDVHVISSPEGEHERIGTPRGPGLPRRRVVAGAVLGLAGLPLLTALLLPFRGSLVLSTILLLYLLAVVGVSSVGGPWVAAATATGAFLLVNWFFTPPFYQWTIAEPANVVALAVFVAVALTVGLLVGIAARRQLQSDRATSEAALLASLAGSLIHSGDPLPELLEKLRTAFGMRAAAIMRKVDNTWSVEAASGEPVPASPTDADTMIEVGEGTDLILVGRKLAGKDRNVLAAFAAQLAVAVRTRILDREAARAFEISRTSDLRAAILAAVSHDLRTPLASIKASVSSLRQKDVSWTDESIEEFLATIEEETDRLDDPCGQSSRHESSPGGGRQDRLPACWLRRGGRKGTGNLARTGAEGGS